MELFQFAAFLDKFGADVLALGALVYGLTFLLKNTLLKKAPKKYVTFVPFLLGVALYAVFALLVDFSAAPLLRQAQTVVQKGISAGCAATVIHVIYEQFIRGASPTETGIKEECVHKLLQGFTEKIPEGLAGRIAAIPADGSTAERIREEIEKNLPDLTEIQISCLETVLERILKNV